RTVCCPRRSGTRCAIAWRLRAIEYRGPIGNTPQSCVIDLRLPRCAARCRGALGTALPAQLRIRPRAGAHRLVDRLDARTLLAGHRGIAAAFGGGELALELVQAVEPGRIEVARVDRGLHRASRLALVATITEPARCGEWSDVGERVDEPGAAVDEAKL